jgi:hypothetical protein
MSCFDPSVRIVKKNHRRKDLYLYSPSLCYMYYSKIKEMNGQGKILLYMDSSKHRLNMELDHHSLLGLHVHC